MEDSNEATSKEPRLKDGDKQNRDGKTIKEDEKMQHEKMAFEHECMNPQVGIHWLFVLCGASQFAMPSLEEEFDTAPWAQDIQKNDWLLPIDVPQ